MKKRKTIYTIAKDLGVAPGTVSKVLNNTGSISEKTRKKVLDYIKEVGYVPTSSARMLKSTRSRTIGVIFSEELDIGLEHSFFASILQHFKSYIESEGYELTFIVTKLGDNKMSYLEWCRNKKVDGVYIVVGNYNDKGISELVKSDIPVISNDMILEGLHTVISDNDTSILNLINYITNDLGKRKIGMVVGPQQSKAFEQRYKAFIKHVSNLDLPIKDHHIVYSEGFGFTSGYQAALSLLANKDDLPEVLIVSSDDIALGVLKSFSEHNVLVPKEIQVIGFDDIPVSKYVTPSLTTIAQDRKALGRVAAQKLITLIENPDEKIDEITLIPTKIIIRESTLK